MRFPFSAPRIRSLLVLALAGCSRGGEAVHGPAEEFRAVAEALEAGDCPHYGRAPRLAAEARLADPALPRKERLELQIELAYALLEAGEVERSIQLLETALGEVRGSPRQEQRVAKELARAWLREAENQNCVARHNAECCIFPPREGALHTVRRPAETARALYRSLLEADPNDLGARWLINVTTLLLGESTAELPESERLPLHVFGEAKGEPLFRDVSAEAGLVVSNLAGGVGVEDFDGDGWLDVVFSNCDPRGPLRYFRSRGDGGFEDRTADSGTSEQLGGLNLVCADVDEDGDQDVLVLRGAWLLDHGRIRNSLLRNDGGERFVDVTHAAGLAEPARPTQTAAFGDFDGDGSLDLYVGNESRLEIEGGGQGDYPSQLFRGDGRGTFVEITRAAGVANDRYAKGVAVGDHDDDGDLDLYVSNIGPNRLYRNDGRAVFTDVAESAGVLEPTGRSFACWFFDADEDGRLDLWVNAYSTSIADLAATALFRPGQGVAPCLYHNDGDGRFTDRARAAGLFPVLTMGANFGDFDGDGWLDVFLGTGDPQLESLMPDVLLRNVEGERFLDQTAPSGLGHLQKGHGVAFADLDGDGDQDLVHQLGGFVPVDAYQDALFENRSAPGGHWLALSLEGTRTNRDGVGARVEIELATPSGPRTLHRAAGSVSSFGGSPHRLEIGLGNALGIERLRVRWPNGGAVQVFEGPPLDAWLRVREGAAEPERLEWRSFRLGAQRERG